MNTQNEFNTPEASDAREPHRAAADSAPSARKHFVEPELTAPVHVLEATTFFNTATSNISPG